MSPQLQNLPIRTTLDFDAQKALETLLYVTKKLPSHNKYWVFKAIYFADKRHLQRYGRFVYGDQYVAMRLGPVPSGARDFVTAADEGANPWCVDIEAAISSMRIEGNRIIPLRDPDMTHFSKSDLECLDEAIEEVRPLDFDTLMRRSHDGAYDSADRNDIMSIESIASLFPNSHELLEYIKDPAPSE